MLRIIYLECCGFATIVTAMAKTKDISFSPPSVPWPRVHVSPVAEALAETLPINAVDRVSRVAATVFFLLSLFLLSVCAWLLWRVWGLAREVRELRSLDSQRQYISATTQADGSIGEETQVLGVAIIPTQVVVPSPSIGLVRQLPDDWERYAFPDISVSVYAPSGYRSDLRMLDTNEYFARFWQGDDPESAKIILRVLPNWNSVADLKEKPRTLRIDRGIYAAKVEPPSKSVAELDQYKTEYAFEYNQRVYVFSCIHNWEQQSIIRCNTMMNSLELGR